MPRDAFERIASRLQPRDLDAVATAYPLAAPLVAPELKMSRIVHAAARVDTRQGFDALLGTSDDALDAAAETVRSLLGRSRAESLRALILRVQSLPDADRAGALAESVQASFELPVAMREPVFAPLIAVACRTPPEERLGAWSSLVAFVEDTPASVRWPVLTSLLYGVRELSAQDRQEAARDGFAAIERLPPHDRHQPLRTLLQSMVVPPALLQPRILRVGLQAVAQLPEKDRAEALALMPALISAMESVDDPLIPGDSARRQAMRAVREALAALPVEQRGPPLAALAGVLPRLPQRERHLDMHVMLNMAKQLPDEGARVALLVLFDNIGRLRQDLQSAAVRDGYRSIRRLQPETQKVLLDKLFDVGGGHTILLLVEAIQRLAAERRTGPLTDLVSRIPRLPAEERSGVTRELLMAIAQQCRPDLSQPLNSLMEAVGDLVRAGAFIEEGFDAIRGGIRALPPKFQAEPLIALAGAIHQWPSQGQVERFAAVRTAARGLSASHQRPVLSRLAEHVHTLPNEHQAAQRRALRAALRGLPR